MRVAALTFLFVAFGVSADSNYYCKAGDITNNQCSKGDVIYVSLSDALKFCDFDEEVITIKGRDSTAMICAYRGKPRVKRGG